MISSPTWASDGGIHLGDDYGIGFGDGGSGRPDFQVITAGDGTLDLRCGFGSDDADITINSSGRVDVNSGDLRVTGGEGTSASLYLIADQGDDNGDGWRINSNQDDNDLTISNDDSGSFTDRMSIQSNGRVNMFNVYGTALSGTMRDVHIEDGGQLGYNSSTRDSKANISLLSNVDWLYQLQPSSFNYKKRDRDGEYTGEVSTELEYGLIAEDVEPIAPELCFYDEVDGEQELRGIHYKKLIVPMLKALQAANTKITTLETKVAALEAAE